MIPLIMECHEFLKGCGCVYAFCGGHAFELFTHKRIRPHSDIDISIFEEDRIKIAEYVLNNGWNVYEHPPYAKCLGLISSPHDDRVLNRFCLWAIKLDCSFLRIAPEPDEGNMFDYEILNKEQLNFDFIEIVFNKRQDGKFVCDADKNITRDLEKAILYDNGVPYLAPEIMLFIISNPVYMESAYHKEKNQIDFDFTAPYLPKESKDWLISALETAYPNGNKRLGILRG